MDVLDKSHYFRGVLLLMKKDFKVSPEEKKFAFKIGKTLGFDKEFVEDSIRDILSNDFIDENPPIFTNQKVAECFIKDGMKLIYTDKNIDPSELNFLEKTAVVNKISMEWFNKIILDEKNKPIYYETEPELEIKTLIEN